MSRKGFRKLCDVYGTLSQAYPIHKLIESYMERHSIELVRHTCMDRQMGYDYYRYYVHVGQLGLAQDVLPLVKDLQEDTDLVTSFPSLAGGESAPNADWDRQRRADDPAR